MESRVEYEALTKANAMAIKELAHAIRELADTVKEEDKDIKSGVSELLKSQTECHFRWQSVMEKMNYKKESITLLQQQVSMKADKEAVEELKSFIHKALWWLFGGMVAVIAFLVKTQLFEKV